VAIVWSAPVQGIAFSPVVLRPALGPRGPSFPGEPSFLPRVWTIGTGRGTLLPLAVLSATGSYRRFWAGQPTGLAGTIATSGSGRGGGIACN
jgi:hypothetical protein